MPAEPPPDVNLQSLVVTIIPPDGSSAIHRSQTALCYAFFVLPTLLAGIHPVHGFMISTFGSLMVIGYPQPGS